MVDRFTAFIGPVVSAAHLADGPMPALSEIEFSLTVLHNAFSRWIVRCMGTAGYPGLGHTDVLILHAVAHRSRDKTLSDLCVMLNIEDTHIVAYALKKLTALGLVEGRRRGKEKTTRATAKGTEACSRYRDVRDALLVDAIAVLGIEQAQLSRIAATLHSLSGHYDQAARTAASL